GPPPTRSSWVRHQGKITRVNRPLQGAGRRLPLYPHRFARVAPSVERRKPMDARLLGKLFGHEQRWHGPCTVIVDSDASIIAIGADSIGSSATKSYAPRLV